MKNHFIGCLYVLSCFVLTGYSHGQVTRADAAAILKKVVSPGPGSGDYSIYLSAAPLATGTVVRSFDDDAPSRSTQASTWFGYIDDAPFALFAHPTRFVFIDEATGAVVVKAERWWPLVDGANPFTQVAVMADTSLLIASSRDEQPVVAP